jgi:site-specific DNA-methyltransferase (cytosine-N4-specific)
MIKANALHMPLKDKSAQSIITSPPYWSLRKYNVPDAVWPDGWQGQLGLEPTPELYIAHLMQVMAECWRVLRDDGVAFINLGDTYAANRSYQVPQTKYKIEYGLPSKVPRGIKPKSLCLIPERFALACQEQGWIIRNSIIWYKRNAMPSSVKDRFNVAHEKIYMMSKQRKYYFDLDVVLEPYTKPLNRWGGEQLRANGESSWDKGTGQGTYRNRNMRPNPRGKNPGDVWDITTQGYPDAHFATFPEKLAERMIICSTKPGDIVLDPFGGSGTVGRVAIRLQRKPGLLDLGYHHLQKKRMDRVQLCLV